MCFIFVAFVHILDKSSQYLLVLRYQTLVCVQHLICGLGMVLDGELVTSENETSCIICFALLCYACECAAVIYSPPRIYPTATMHCTCRTANNTYGTLPQPNTPTPSGLHSCHSNTSSLQIRRSSRAVYRTGTIKPLAYPPALSLFHPLTLSVLHLSSYSRNPAEAPITHSEPAKIPQNS